MENLIRDVRYACRGLLAQPAWTASAVICLAIATGANTAAFSAVNAVAFRPLPFERADQIVMIALNEGGRGARPVFLHEYRELAARSGATFEALSTWTFQPLALATEQGGRMVQAQFVSGNYFQMLRVAPSAGQVFGSDADREGVPLQAVFSDRLWRQIYGADPFTPGRVARVDGQPIQVVGVAPRDFVGAMGLIVSDLWLPAAGHAGVTRPPQLVPAFGLVGRRREGITNDQARAQLDVIAADLSRQRGAAAVATTLVETASGFGVPPGLKRPITSASAVVFGLIALLVAVAAANVASLILARATGRDREVGVKLALGATWWRIARQMLTEGVVLTLAGSAAGIGLAVATTRLANGIGSGFQYVSYGIDFRPDLRVFVYASAAALGLALLCGLVPARLTSRRNLVDVLKRSPSGGRRSPLRSLSTLVAGQIAVSTMLLAVAGLLARTYVNTQSIDRGFDTRNLVLATIDLGQVRLGPVEGRRAYEDLVRRIAALPGVDRAALASEPVVAPPAANVAIWPEEGASIQAASVAVNPEYFETIGLRALQGRLLQPLDSGVPRVAVVNEALARRLWLSGSPIGRRFNAVTRDGEPLEVVGLVRDIGSRALSDVSRPMFYEPFAQRYASQMTVTVRSARAPSALIAAITQEISRTHSDLAVLDIQTAENRLATNTSARRLSAQVLGVVSLLGLILTGVGLFGVLSYAARQRLREFGIRIALGAQGRDVRAMIAKHGLMIMIPGVAFGLAGSLFLARIVAGVLFGVGAADPITFAGVSITLAAVTALALYLPARWATRVNPVVVLREE